NAFSERTSGSTTNNQSGGRPASPAPSRRLSSAARPTCAPPCRGRGRGDIRYSPRTISACTVSGSFSSRSSIRRKCSRRLVVVPALISSGRLARLLRHGRLTDQPAQLRQRFVQRLFAGGREARDLG